LIGKGARSGLLFYNDRSRKRVEQLQPEARSSCEKYLPGEKTVRIPGYRFCVLMTAVFAMTAATGSPAAARPLAAIKASGTLKVGFTGDYAPFSLRGANGTMAGADVTMARALAKELGVSLVIVPTTWTSMTSDFRADRFDIAMGGISVTADRAALGDFSVPLLHDGKRPIVRCADKDRYVSVADIDRPEVRVAVNPGGTNERFAKANFPQARIEEHADNRTIFDAIVAGRADVMVTDGSEVDYQSRLHPGVLCPADVPASFDHADKAYWMTRDPALKQAVDAWLTRNLQADIYRQALIDAAAKHG
jgi:cyclohexadienyl dehydratase